MDLFEKLVRKEDKLSVIGLGYVGLPIALEFARKIRVVGFDIREDRIEMMRQGVDPSDELPAEAFHDCDIEFTADPDDLRDCRFHIIAVPTPIDRHNLPDLSPLIKASQTVGRILKKGDYVVYESTVYPGATEEDCLPVLEEESGLRSGSDFKIGYSPERINPGDQEHSLTTVMKIVSGCDAEALDVIARTYELVVRPGVYRAPTIKVAEAAKIIENSQRDINIAFMNELSLIFNRMNINLYDVIDAAATKWNFLKFYPGLVGGHCIGVDPYYLTFKAEEYRFHARVINAGRYVNDSMGFYVAKQTVKKLIAAGKNIQHSKVLVMGITFKENVSDLRNSRVADVVTELRQYGVSVDVVDPYVNGEELMQEYGFGLVKEPAGNYDAVIVAVSHTPYVALDEAYFRSISTPGGILIDVKGIYRKKIREMTYWSL
jgi:UDP-N-acetyl-D-galactosamine dehydrogenase